MRILLTLLFACSPERVVPDAGSPLDLELPALGTFCYTLDGAESCAADPVVASRVLDAGAVWFRVDAQIALSVTNDDMATATPASLRLSGSLPDAALPARASAVSLVVPVVAGCHRVVQIDPFGQCAMRDAELVCNLDAAGDEGEVLVQAFDDGVVGGTFRASLLLDSGGCCASTPSCANPSEHIDPVPAQITGRFLQPF